MRNKKTWLLVLLLMLTHGICRAQDFYYEPGFEWGHYTPFSANHKYIADYHHYGLDLRIGKGHQGLLIGYTHHTLDSVIYYTHDGNRYGSIGDCFSLAYFVDGPIYKGKRWSFDYDIIFGADRWTRHPRPGVPPADRWTHPQPQPVPAAPSFSSYCLSSPPTPTRKRATDPDKTKCDEENAYKFKTGWQAWERSQGNL